MSKLTIILGPPCAGKSTIIQKRITNKDTVFDWDLLQRALTNTEIHTQREEIKSMLLGFRKIFINESQVNREIENFYLLACYMSPKLQKQLEGAKYQIEHINATKEECLERLYKDNSRSDKKMFEKRINEWFDSNKSEDKINGYALMFDEWNYISKHQRQKITKGALSEAVLKDVRLLFNHDWNKVLARQGAGTLTLTIDDKGLRYTSSLTNASYAKEVFNMIKSNNYNCCEIKVKYNEKNSKRSYNAKEQVYDTIISKVDEVVEISILNETDVNNNKVYVKSGENDLKRINKLKEELSNL